MFKLEGAFGHGLMDLKSLSLFVRKKKKKVFFFFFFLFVCIKKKWECLEEKGSMKMNYHTHKKKKKKKKKKVRENKKGKDLRGSCGGEVRKVRKDLL